VRLRFAGALVAAFLVLLPGCQRPLRGPDRTCTELAYAFYVVAEEKDRGTSKEAQIEKARESLRTADPAALSQMLHIIDLVYRFSDGTPQDIGATVLDNCAIDQNGQAVVRTLWPTR
jgi:hypothetical protein